jgi:hypothetical protein
LTLDATQVFDPYDPPVFAGFGQAVPQPRKKGPLRALTKAQVQQLFMRHSFEVKIRQMIDDNAGKLLIQTNNRRKLDPRRMQL